MQYKDYFSQWGEPWAFTQWTQESFITHRGNISRMWMSQKQQQNSTMLVQISKHILKFTSTNTKFSGHCEQGLQGIWISSRLSESRSTQHAWKLSWTRWNYPSIAYYRQHLVWTYGLPNQLSTWGLHQSCNLYNNNNQTSGRTSDVWNIFSQGIACIKLWLYYG